MQIFVTGSTGLLGNNLVRALVGEGQQVRCLVRSRDKGEMQLGDLGVTFIEGDMLNVPAFAEALEDCEAVFHTAAYFREYFQPGDHAQKLHDINVRGTLNLMAEADRRGARRFIHVSSAGVIGMQPDGSPGDESTPPSALALENLYIKSKVDGDAEIKAWQAERGMQVIEILPGWMWGPGDAAPTAAGQMALDFLHKKIPGIIGGGLPIVDARDVAATMIAALDRGADRERYIVGGPFFKIEELLHRLEAVTGVPAPTRHLPYVALMAFALVQEIYGRLTGNNVLLTRLGVKLIHSEHSVNSAKAERELGATFRPLDDTLRDVVEWYRAHDRAPQPA